MASHISVEKPTAMSTKRQMRPFGCVLMDLDLEISNGAKQALLKAESYKHIDVKKYDYWMFIHHHFRSRL
jgi:hypothetical protein